MSVLVVEHPFAETSQMVASCENSIKLLPLHVVSAQNMPQTYLCKLALNCSLFYCLSGDCTHGDVKLVGGQTALEGRVEVCYGGVWSTVTNDYWGFQDARVVCRQLGYDDKSEFPLSYVSTSLLIIKVFSDISSVF